MLSLPKKLFHRSITMCLTLFFLQDQRLVDLPLALPFFKMLCRGLEQVTDVMSEDENSDSEEISESFLLKSGEDRIVVNS